MSSTPYDLLLPPTRLDRALDTAVARENAAPRGLPLEDLAALEAHPGVRHAFRVAAAKRKLPDPFPEDETCDDGAGVTALVRRAADGQIDALACAACGIDLVDDDRSPFYDAATDDGIPHACPAVAGSPA